MNPKFNVQFLPHAIEFLDQLPHKPREKIYYNMNKSRYIQQSDLFKKLNENIWEFRTLYDGVSYRLFAFWYNNGVEQSLVIATHGIFKKSKKTPKQEIKKAEEIRKYFIENVNSEL
jgi:phage-related protein